MLTTGTRSLSYRLWRFAAAACYCLSVGVLILQLLAFTGSQFTYGLMILLHACVFWLVTLRGNRASRIGRALSVVVGACVIGAIPFRPTFMAATSLVTGADYHFSSFTRDLPIWMRAFYEIGLFPCIQLLLLVGASQLLEGSKRK